jgi:Na+/melibiose symporter-like transporter
MDRMPEEKILSKRRLVMYAIGFVFNLSYAIPTYVNSTFLSQIIGDKLVGIIYTASSILAIAAFIEIPGIMKRFGNFRTTICLLFLEIFSLAGLVLGNNTLAIISAFMLNFVCIALINFTLDVFLEGFSSNTQTGRIRGTFLTIANTAWLISPFIASRVLGENAFGNIYASSGLLLIPVVGLVFFSLGNIKEPAYVKMPFWKSFGEVWSDKNIKGVLFIQFLLQFFYAWMIIYTPLYLHDTIGFDWGTIGGIFTFMLLPFVLLDLPLGRLADRNGEKKVLSLGFILIGLATFLMAFITDHNPVIWTIALFLTRLGSASVEVMADTYFFKKVDATRTNIISFSRMMRPFAYILSPVIATILFTVFDVKGLFVFLGLLMLYGVRYSLAIEDTK